MTLRTQLKRWRSAGCAQRVMAFSDELGTYDRASLLNNAVEFNKMLQSSDVETPMPASQLVDIAITDFENSGVRPRLTAIDDDRPERALIGIFNGICLSLVLWGLTYIFTR